MAELVVVGTVQEISEGDSLRYDLTISVEEYLKGTGAGNLTIRDPGSNCSAFGSHSEGTRYLLFLRTYKGRLTTSVCDGSGAIGGDNGRYAPTVIQQIRQIVAGAPLATQTPRGDDLAATETVPAPGFPTSGTGGSESDGNRAWVITGVAALAALGLAGAAAVAWRGARRA